MSADELTADQIAVLKAFGPSGETSLDEIQRELGWREESFAFDRIVRALQPLLAKGYVRKCYDGDRYWRTLDWRTLDDFGHASGMPGPSI